jgi:Zn-dependent M28 family amino/carboxypeptidase
VKNVVGLLPGQIRDEYVVVGAHYDHLGRGGIGSLNRGNEEIHNGADDNASGTTAVLELASKLSREGTPKRSIIFAAFTGEEEGLFGSKRFVDHPPVSLSKIMAMINLDMVGRVRTTPSGMHPGTAPATTPSSTRGGAGILYIGGAGTAAAFDAIVKSADEHSPLVIKDIGKGGLGPSDHMSFALKRVPVLFFFSGLHADYHRPTDDADKINYEGLEQVVDLAADVIDQVAAMPKQEYIVAADAHSMSMGTPSTRTTVTLGVVPDYSSTSEGGGVKISGTSSGSPAAKAGLKEGDVIVQWDEKKLDTLYDLSDVLSRGKPGQKVKLKLIRDGKTIETEATLVKRQ